MASSASVSKRFTAAAALLSAVAAFFSSCEWMPRPQAPSPGPSPSPSSAEYQYTTEAGKRAKANQELLNEMVRVVIERPLKDPTQFGGLLSVLNQGASFEGVYNGLTHSGDYRKLEIANPEASASAVKDFAEMVADLDAELPKPTEFTAASAGPLPVLTPPTGLDETPSEITFSKPAPKVSPKDTAKDPNESKKLEETLSKLFAKSSIYTLKRILGDEALKVVALKRPFPEKLASWYSKWVVRMAGYKVDFGLELRNKPDEAFHYKWAFEKAKAGAQDKICWEVLNRLHRVLNEANKRKP